MQFSDNLTKVYKSHTFKSGYMYQHIFFGSTQPPYARGEYHWDGRYTSMVNATDNSTSRAHFLLAQIPSLVPGGVDYLGGMHDLRVSPFGDVDAFKTYHGAYVQDSWRVTSKLTVNYGLRWDWFSREQEREGEQANLVPGPPGAQYLIPAEQRNVPLSPSFVSNLAKDGIELVYTDEFGSGLGKMPKNNFAPRFDVAYQFNDKNVLRAGYGLFYGAFENRGGNPSLGYNYPFQFTLIYLSPNDVAPNRLPDGSLVGLDARERHPARSARRQRQRALAARGRVRLQDAALPQLQRDAADRAAGPARGRSRLRGHARDATSRRSSTEQRHEAAAAGHDPGPARDVPRLRRGAHRSCARSASARTTRCSSSSSAATTRACSSSSATRCSDAKTNAGDSLSGGGVGGLRAPDVVGWDLANDIGAVGLPHQARPGLERQLRPPRQGADLRRLAHQLGDVVLQRPGADDQLHAGDRLGHRLLRAASSATRTPAATTCRSSTTRRRSPTRPRSRRSGRPTSARSAASAARSLARRCARSTSAWRVQFRLWGQTRAEFRVESFNLTNTPAFNLPGSLNFGDARNFASISSMRNTPRQIQLGAKFYW